MTAPVRHWRHYSGTTDEKGQLWLETTNPNGSYAVSAGGWAEWDHTGNSTSTLERPDGSSPGAADTRIRMLGAVPFYDSGTDTLKFIVGFAVDGNWRYVGMRVHVWALVL
jgi:hypothetical protein